MTSKIKQGMHLRQPENSSDGAWIFQTLAAMLACGALLILAMACGSDPFGYDYLYPLMPPGKAALRDGFVRAIWSRLAQKGEVLPRHAKE